MRRKASKYFARERSCAIFPFRQGLWTADSRIPPGQECSNGSLILFAVVLWRTFFAQRQLQTEDTMKLLKVRTVRFTEVVAKADQPEAYTLWVKPKTDRRLQSLIKNHRIMTIQSSESGTDFGIIEFCERKGARYLAFPKSLKGFANQRVIGIDWELVKS